MKTKENVKNKNFTKLTQRGGISLIVLVITIIVIIIIILASAVILTINNNNPVAEANKARYESDRANMQAVFTNAIAKVMTHNRATVSVTAGQVNTITSGVNQTTGEISYTVTEAENSANASGKVVFGKGNSTDTVFYTGKELPIYAAGETKWYVDKEGNITLEVAGVKYGEGETIFLEGAGQTYHTLAPSTLTFRSTADLADFKEVQINGETIDSSNYTLTEGSTIVTLSIDYLKTLNADKHEITVVSKSGSPTAGFEVIQPKVNEYNFYYNQPYTAYVDAYNFNAAFLLREDGTVNIAIFEDASINVVNGTFEFTENGFIVTQQDLGTFTFSITGDKNKIYNVDLDVDFILDEQNIVADDDYVYVYSSSLNGYSATVIDNNKAHYGMLKSNINGKPLMHIASGMFEDNTNLKSLPEFPKSWMMSNNTGHAWGEGLFEGCTGLTTANIPDFFSGLPYGLFMDCTNLMSVTIPDSITNSGADVFKNCTSLTEIIFEGTVEQLMSITEFKYYEDYGIFENVPATEVKCSNGTVAIR